MNLLLLPTIPLIAALLSALPLGGRLARTFAPAVTLLAGIAIFSLTIIDGFGVIARHSLTAISGWVAVDGLSMVILLLVAFVSMMAALFSCGYIAAHEYTPRRARSYYVHFNLFVFALVLVPVVTEPALVWIAVELTAMLSVLLVAFEDTHAALEAAWKYVALMFMGAAIALVGFFILFQAQEKIGGGYYSWDGLRAAASQMSPTLVKTAFLFILVGFGVKVGFVPMHTWLPDAHSQAPSPACAMLSGLKTTVVLYVLFRLFPLLPAGRVQIWMQVIGLLSLGVAAFLLLRVRDYKRMFAFSTVEHMGIIFIAAGLGSAGGDYAAMLQIISHALTKSFCFFAAGGVLLLLGTREIAAIRGLIRTSPAVGSALMLGALAIGGAPPFAVFLSEFAIFRAGLEHGDYLTIALLVIFVVIAFFGILLQVDYMTFGEPTLQPIRKRLPFTCSLTLILAAIPICVLGVYQPPQLHALLKLAAAQLAPAF